LWSIKNYWSGYVFGISVPNGSLSVVSWVSRKRIYEELLGCYCFNSCAFAISSNGGPGLELSNIGFSVFSIGVGDKWAYSMGSL